MKKIFALIILFLLPTLALAETKVIYAWGYGDILGETLQMVAFLFSFGEYRSAWKVLLLFAFIGGLIATLSPKGDFLAIPKLFLLSLGVWAVFMTAKVDVQIRDLANNRNDRNIANVSWAVAYPMSLISALDYRIGQAYENLSSIPASLRYTNGGMALPLSMFNASTTMKITDTTFSQNVHNYILECAIPDFLSGYKDINFALNTKDLWNYLGGTNPALIVPIRNDDGTTSYLNCLDAYGNLNAKMGVYFSMVGDGMRHLAQQVNLTGNAALASSQLGLSHQYLHGATKNASAIMTQNAATHAFSEAFGTFAGMNGTDATGLAMYAGKAESVASANMMISGVLGSKYIPVTKGILTAIIAGLTPMLALVMLTPMAVKSFLGYITMLAWLATWHLGEVILNHLVLIKAKSAMTLASGGGDLTPQLKPIVSAVSLDYINMISSMYWMVPTISGLIVGGFSMGALASMTGGITGRTAKGEAAGAEMGTGSWQSGTVRMNSTSANKHDTALLSSIGAMSNVNSSFNADFNNRASALNTSANAGALWGSTGSNMQSAAEILANGIGTSFGGNYTTTQNGDGTFTKNGTFTNVNSSTGVTTTYTGTMTTDANGKILNAQDMGVLIANKDGTSINGKVSFADGKMTGAEVKHSDGSTSKITKQGDGYIEERRLADGSVAAARLNNDGKINELIYGKSVHIQAESTFDNSTEKSEGKNIQQGKSYDKGQERGDSSSYNETAITTNVNQITKGTDAKASVDPTRALKNIGKAADPTKSKGNKDGNNAVGDAIDGMGMSAGISTSSTALESERGESGRSGGSSNAYNRKAGTSEGGNIGNTYGSNEKESHRETISSDKLWTKFMNEKYVGKTMDELSHDMTYKFNELAAEYKEWLKNNGSIKPVEGTGDPQAKEVEDKFNRFDNTLSQGGQEFVDGKINNVNDERETIEIKQKKLKEDHTNFGLASLALNVGTGILGAVAGKTKDSIEVVGEVIPVEDYKRIGNEVIIDAEIIENPPQIGNKGKPKQIGMKKGK